jgi:tetratricopeptide (TPR) repeat protein
VGDQLGEAHTLDNLGSVSRCLGDYQEALIYNQQSLAVFREIRDPRSESDCHNNLGRIYRTLGDYVEARNHFEHALNISRQIGAKQPEGEILAELSLLYHHLKDDKGAESCAKQARDISQEIDDRSVQGQAWTNFGHSLMGQGYLNEAAKAYQQALKLRREMGQHYLATEPLTGLAQIAMDQGKITVAQNHVKEIISYLETGSLNGTDDPIHVYLICYQVLQVTDPPHAIVILKEAYHLLQERAAKINDHELRKSFMENVAANRELIAAFRALQTSPQERQIMVSLPRHDAPQGRPLREDEYVSVRWTLSTLEDQKITGKATQRRQRLLRLLNEAHEQGAIPRNEDLIAVLGVSLATLRRDLAVLRGQGTTLPPRRRKLRP